MSILAPRKSGDESTEVRIPPLPCDFQIPILYQDDGILVVNKPYDIRVDGDFPITVEKLVRHVRGMVMDKFRLCNQLDYATSGILVLGKTKVGAGNSNRLFSERKTIKYYLAIGTGCLCHPIGEPIRVCEKISEIQNDFRMRIDPINGLYAETLVTPIAQLEDNRIFFLVQILTGRRHQIRLHLQHLGYPILGDATYGSDDRESSDRMMLHAWKLILPFKDRKVEIRAPLMDEDGLSTALENKYITELESLSSN